MKRLVRIRIATLGVSLMLVSLRASASWFDHGWGRSFDESQYTQIIYGICMIVGMWRSVFALVEISDYHLGKIQSPLPRQSMRKFFFAILLVNIKLFVTILFNTFDIT